ncbi:hypothetical protein JCM11491_000821 [Sporobolomyces phaffii]
MTTTTPNHHLNRSFGQSSRASSSTQPYEQATAGTQKFVIGKIDAGIAVLISDSVHLIEFPSLLLPSGVGPGSIVNIACTRNFSAERSAAKEFWDLQREIKECFGDREPLPPKLRIRNTTQTSVTLEWDKLDLAAASLISLSIYRNNQRLTTIPSPLTNTSTKLSGLQLDTDYTFHLVLKTSAGTYSSPVVKTRTHTIDNTSGISVCFGYVEPNELLEQAKEAVREMGAKWDDKIQIDTTHFVATSSASRTEPRGGPGVEYQKAVQLSIPVVSPEWLLSCHRSSKLVPISAFYLGTTNHAASLSSAQLVSSPQTQQAPASVPRQITSNTTMSAAPATVREEPEAEVEAVEAPPVQLEEDVEGPPEEQREMSHGEESTDASTKAVKSEVEPEVAAKAEEEEEEDTPAEAEKEKEQEETPVEEANEPTAEAEEGDARAHVEQPSSGVPQEAVVVETESESAHEVEHPTAAAEEDADEEATEVPTITTTEPEEPAADTDGVAGTDTPRSDAQESVDLDDAFEETEDDIVPETTEEPKEKADEETEKDVQDEAEGEGEAEGDKSSVDIEL